MASRMDKYNSNTIKKKQSRSKKNEHLYSELYTNKVYTEFADVANNMIDLDNISSNNKVNRREDFQKKKILNQDEDNYLKPNHLEKSIDNSSTLETKNYNINEILENARKNRTTDEEIEQKHHFKTVEYSIISDLTNDKLKEVQEKSQKLSKSEEENLEELINTITSNSLRKKIDDELLSDLLPTQEMETLVSDKLLSDLEKYDDVANDSDKNENEDDNSDNEMAIDKSFYTRSMDLSEEDFDSYEDDSFIEQPKFGLLKKILMFVFVAIIIFLICFVLYRFI